ncbi:MULTISPECIES: glycosyltransferase [Vibrio]|uniref:glycosyltransferase n=1 Tax=Vibrio TaxID=662 RepID=UPI000619E092|nr:MULTISPECIES: glycosyltransferase [Vibrio]QCI72093.1 glycosyltransferase [Vibrio cyclitrophicus]
MSRLVGVAMSVYKSDRADFLRLALDSILDQVNVRLNLYLHIDGEVDNLILSLLGEYEARSNVRIYRHDENLGLATRLNESIEQAISDEVDFIARMDADDISKLDRFDKQISYLESDTSIDVVGSDVVEISEAGEELFYKSMASDHETLALNIIKKCPFNHPSVMFRVRVFKDGFRYDNELKNTQDYYLWVDLLSSGYLFANINEPLLYFRVNDTFHSRRGLKKAINDCKSRFYAFSKLNNVSLSNVIHVVKLFILRLAPRPIKVLAYKLFR